MRRVAVAFACAALTVPATAAAHPPLPTSSPRWKAVLVAGDASLPVFDDAVVDVAARLRERDGLPPGDIQRLSAAPGIVAPGGAPGIVAHGGAPGIVAHGGARLASLGNVLDAVASMKPAAGQGCFVFATSHGAPYRGLVLTASGREALSPQALDRALVRGCGDAPTAVVISGCFSGIYAQPPMTRANRIVLTAARPDRASFGCGAGSVYTVYDRCLINAMNARDTWRRAYGSIRRCVTGVERQGRFIPSEPQAWFGPAVTGLPLPTAASSQAR